MENDIDLTKWTLYDKVMYGGLGYGSFCLPTDFFKIIITIIFPPLGEIMNCIGNDLTIGFPFINWKVVKNLFTYENLNKIVYSFILTTLFYIPALVYTLRNISDKDKAFLYKDTYFNNK